MLSYLVLLSCLTCLQLVEIYWFYHLDMKEDLNVFLRNNETPPIPLPSMSLDVESFSIPNHMKKIKKMNT